MPHVSWEAWQYWGTAQTSEPLGRSAVHYFNVVWVAVHVKLLVRSSLRSGLLSVTAGRVFGSLVWYVAAGGWPDVGQTDHDKSVCVDGMIFFYITFNMRPVCVGMLMGWRCCPWWQRQVVYFIVVPFEDPRKPLFLVFLLTEIVTSPDEWVTWIKITRRYSFFLLRCFNALHCWCQKGSYVWTCCVNM